MRDSIINYGKVAIRHKIIDESFSSAGAHSLTLNSGQYEIWLVGAGGGGSGTTGISSSVSINRGGVGGVLHVKVNVPDVVTITINVGSGGASSGGSGDHAGVNGQNTSITGLNNVSIYAGGGTRGTTTHTGSISIKSVPGVQGTNSATGGNLLQIIENNPVQVISVYGEAGVQPNDGWPENTNVGCGGGFSAKTTSFPTISGGTGFARVKKVA